MHMELQEAQAKKQFFFYDKKLPKLQWSPTREKCLREKQKSLSDLRYIYQNSAGKDNLNTPLRRGAIYKRTMPDFNRNSSFLDLYAKYKTLGDEAKQKNFTGCIKGRKSYAAHSKGSPRLGPYMEILERTRKAKHGPVLYGTHINDQFNRYEIYVSNLKKVSRSCPDLKAKLKGSWCSAAERGTGTSKQFNASSALRSNVPSVLQQTPAAQVKAGENILKNRTDSCVPVRVRLEESAYRQQANVFPNENSCRNQKKFFSSESSFKKCNLSDRNQSEFDQNIHAHSEFEHLATSKIPDAFQNFDGQIVPVQKERDTHSPLEKPQISCQKVKGCYDDKSRSPFLTSKNTGCLPKTFEVFRDNDDRSENMRNRNSDVYCMSLGCKHLRCPAASANHLTLSPGSLNPSTNDKYTTGAGEGSFENFTSRDVGGHFVNNPTGNEQSVCDNQLKVELRRNHLPENESDLNPSECKQLALHTLYKDELRKGELTILGAHLSRNPVPGIRPTDIYPQRSRPCHVEEGNSFDGYDAESPHNKRPSPESSPPAPAQRSPHGSWDRRRRDEADERRRIRVQQITEEEKKKKAIQEQLDAQARRHSDYFTPAQKSPIPTDRFDRYQGKNMKKKPEIHGKARALYNFSAQSPRELSFRKGDIILLIKKVDKNWFEGEHHGKTGLFPVNYVEVITSVEAAHLQDLVSEGQAVAKFNFTAQTKVEMSVKKGEVVVLIRRVDENWYEAKIGSRHGIVPVSYLEVVREPTKRAFSPISVSSSHPMSPVNYNGPLSPTPGAPARPQQPVSWSPTQRSASPSSQTRTQYSPQSSPRTIHARSIVTKQSSPPHDQHPGSAYSTQTWSPTYRSASPRDYTDAGGRPAQNRVAPPSGHSGSQPQSFSTQTWTGGSPSLVRATDVHRGAPDVGYTQEIRAPSPTTFSSITMSTSVKDKDKKKKHIIVQPAPISEHQTSVNLQQTVIPQQIPVFKCEGEDEFLPYQAVYPYHPQNEDELELKEKDIVYVMEKCDDGWFVGTCVRTGQFGTFPGNYVEPVYATVYRAPGSLEIQLAPN
ncbi:sorbin and SH3 domain-containing protein 1 isoform X4 [Lingula anatina]|uniref:Sorbin and SH3 domain-containing protein 1 isoform X4 n=1 Tax=Lingula anatina TaxID=7574 RepID=A0A1S3K309_LINAN|nr:sorbin and SH3 domain-containing protein 1 isoform X4 [Lingula anatina]|eukprot:XP_013416799.1 sorbin and SH3 domain-containing protein 1 isoform X4 [Lingula anatina]